MYVFVFAVFILHVSISVQSQRTGAAGSRNEFGLGFRLCLYPTGQSCAFGGCRAAFCA